MVFRFLSTTIGKLFGSSQPITCQAEVVLPESQYTVKPSVLVPVCVDAMVQLRCSVKREKGSDDKFTVTPGKVSIDTALLKGTDKESVLKYPVILERVDVTSCFSEVPFKMPFNLNVQHIGRYAQKQYAFSIEKNATTTKTPTKPIMKHEFNSRHILETYACVYNEIMEFEPQISPNGLYYIIPTNCAFFELCKQLQQPLTEVLRSGECFNPSKSVEFNVRDNPDDVDQVTGTVHSVRMARDTYIGIKEYLKTTIFDHIQFTNLEASNIEVRTNEIGFNNSLGTLFLSKLDEIQTQQKNIVDEKNNDFRTPHNIEFDVQNNLSCLVGLSFSFYVLYPPHLAPVHTTTYTRRLDLVDRIKFPDPRQANRVESPSFVPIEQQLLNAKKLEEEKRRKKVQEAIQIRYTEIKPQPDATPPEKYPGGPLVETRPLLPPKTTSNTQPLLPTNNSVQDYSKIFDETVAQQEKNEAIIEEEEETKDEGKEVVEESKEPTKETSSN
jgi:hypothetical protein